MPLLGVLAVLTLGRQIRVAAVPVGIPTEQPKGSLTVNDRLCQGTKRRPRHRTQQRPGIPTRPQRQQVRQRPHITGLQMQPHHQLGLNSPQRNVANSRTGGRQPLNVGRFQGVCRSRPQQEPVLADNLVLCTLLGNRPPATVPGPEPHPAMLEPAHPPPPPQTRPHSTHRINPGLFRSRQHLHAIR